MKTKTATTVLVLQVNGDIEVHRPGCADIKRSIRRHHGEPGWKVEVVAGQSVADAVAADLNASFGFVSEEQYGEPAPWNASHIRVLPCVAKGGAL